MKALYHRGLHHSELKKILQGVLLIAFYFELLAHRNRIYMALFFTQKYMNVQYHALITMDIKYFMKPCINKIFVITVLLFIYCLNPQGQAFNLILAVD